MARTNDISLREVSNQEVTKADLAYEQAIKESNLFPLGKFKMDNDFNQDHTISALLDFPSIPPFAIDSDTEIFIRIRAYELHRGKSISPIMKLLFRFNRLLYSIFPQGFSAIIPLTSLAETVCLLDDKTQSELSNHSQQIRKWNVMALPIYVAVKPGFWMCVAYAILVIFSLIIGISSKNLPPLVSAGIIVIALVFIGIVSFGYLVVPTRVIARQLTNKYQESICVREIIYLLFELKNNQFSLNNGIRRNIQYRLSRLARETRGLAKHISSLSKDNQQWLDNHFGQMAAYILERERWLLAPMPNTMNELESDLQKLASIYISGNYGSFQWDSSNVVQLKSDSWLLRALKAAGRVIAFLIPIGLMIWVLTNPTIITLLNITPSLITILMVAWILLGIDSVLKLGVVSNLLNLAKGIRDLS